MRFSAQLSPSQVSNTNDFRQTLFFEHKINIGHYTRTGHNFLDDFYAALKKKLLFHQIVIPKQSLLSVKGRFEEREIGNYAKYSKSTKIVENADQGMISENEYEMLIDTWNAFLKIPRCISKYSGKNSNLWKSGVFCKLYKFLIHDVDNSFEEDRELNIPLLNKTLISSNGIFVLGMQKNKELRDLFKRAKNKQHASSIELKISKLSVGGVLLPFFGCQEQGDCGSQFQAENELACALKNFLDCQVVFHGKEENKFVVGLTCVGSFATAFVMRTLKDEQQKQSGVTYVMQPIDTFNMNLFDDLLKLARFLSAVRRYGQELVDDVFDKLSSLCGDEQESSEELDSDSDEPSHEHMKENGDKKRHNEDDNSPNAKKKKLENGNVQESTTS